MSKISVNKIENIKNSCLIKTFRCNLCLVGSHIIIIEHSTFSIDFKAVIKYSNYCQYENDIK